MHKLSEFIKKIEEFDSVVIFGHIYPDGDCYGSQIGLKELIKNHYPHKKVFAIGSGFKRMIPFIAPMDIVDDEVIKNSLAIAVDFAQISRAEDQRILIAKDKIVIDHHVLTDTFGSWHWIDEKRVATCEMIAELAFKLKWEMSKIAASALYLGLVTDSGRFQYQPLTSKTFSLAAYLIKKGANPDALYLPLYETDEESLIVKGYIYSTYNKTESGIIYKLFTKEELEKLAISSQYAVGSVNLLGNIKNHPIWLSASEIPESGRIKVEVRSSEYNIQPTCVAHTGGGHPLAAGCTVDTWNEVRTIINELDELIKKGEKFNDR